MKAEATEAARRILGAGGNAFDAAVAGQAALAVTDFPSNGVGSDAVVLLYDAREKKVFSINAEPRAPKLATIDCQRKVEMSSFSQGRNVRLQGFLQGCSGGTWYLGLNSLGGCAFRFASPEGRRPEGLAKTGVGSGQCRRRK